MDAEFRRRRAEGWEGTPFENRHTRLRAQRAQMAPLIEAIESQLWVDCPVHGDRQPADPDIEPATCAHCADPGSLERDHLDDGG